MTNKKNSGFSIVEVIIALAIFTILMMPIVSTILSSMNTNTKGKEQQYRNEFAQHLLEYAKEDSLENVLKDTYYKSVGSYDVEIAMVEKAEIPYIAKEKVTDESGHETIVETNKKAPYETYTIKGSMNLGTKHTKYSYVMQISNKSYAEQQAKRQNEGLDYENPNDLAMGLIEDLDYKKVALISGMMANYDSAVSNTFLTRKLQLLRELAPDVYDSYVTGTSVGNPFSSDGVQRKIVISASGPDATGQYKVECKMQYKDLTGYELPDGTSLSGVMNTRGLDTVEYVPYSTTFEKLPNIYLMYNACVYNGYYSPKDYIICDTSGMTDDSPVNVYVVETASNYSENATNVLADAGGLTDAEKTALQNKTLYKKADDNSGRENVEIYMAATKGSTLANLSVYHNFDIDPAVIADSARKNKKNQKFYYDTLGGLSSSNYSTLSGPATVRALNAAQDVERGLYQIKVWIQKGEKTDVDTTEGYQIIEGTKGGDES